MESRASPRLPQGAPTEEILDHFVSGASWSVPTTIRVDATGNRFGVPALAWHGDELHLKAHAGPGLLEDFVKLARASDETILGYARRWGPLWLCGHALPFSHQDNCWVAYDT